MNEALQIAFAPDLAIEDQSTRSRSLRIGLQDQVCKRHKLIAKSYQPSQTITAWQ